MVTSLYNIINLLNLNQMKKILTFVLVTMAAMAVNAKQVTFTFNDATAITSYGITVPDAGNGTDLSGTTFTVDGITFSCEKVNKNDTRIWNSSGNYSLRTYKDNTITFTSAGDNIKGLQVFSTQGGFAELSNGVMTCDAKEATITCTATAYVNSIVVYVNETPVVTVDTLDVNAAIDLIAAAPNKKLAKNMCVRGRVTSINNSGAAQYGNIDVYMVDITNPADTMEAYRMKSFGGADYKDASEIQFGEGDTIIFSSSDWSYYEAGEVYEGFGCSLVKVYGGGHPVVVETITVAQALEIGNALEDNAKTTETYVVEAFVVKAYPVDEKYNNQSFYMSDDATAERGDFFAKYTTGDVVVEGDRVQVKGQIEKNVKDDKTTIQIYKGVATLAPVGLRNVKSSIKAKKVIENGQFMIEANGVRFNMLGARF